MSQSINLFKKLVSEQFLQCCRGSLVKFAPAFEQRGIASNLLRHLKGPTVLEDSIDVGDQFPRDHRDLLALACLAKPPIVRSTTRVRAYRDRTGGVSTERSTGDLPLDLGELTLEVSSEAVGRFGGKRTREEAR